MAIAYLPQEPVISALGTSGYGTHSAVRQQGYTSMVDAPVSC